MAALTKNQQPTTNNQQPTTNNRQDFHGGTKMLTRRQTFSILMSQMVIVKSDYTAGWPRLPLWATWVPTAQEVHGEASLGGEPLPTSRGGGWPKVAGFSESGVDDAPAT